MERNWISNFKKIINDTIVTLYFPTIVTVSSSNGIDLKDDEFLDALKLDQEHKLETGKVIQKATGVLPPKYDNSQIINNCYRMADFLTRTFVLLGSDFAGKGAQLMKDATDVEAHEHDKKRMKRDRVPLVPLRPIVIDLAKIPQKFFHSNDPKETRQLLGWTSVRRTHVVNKYGTEFWRKEHDRRIPSEVDRRDVARVLTNSNETLRLELQGGQPVRSLGQLRTS